MKRPSPSSQTRQAPAPLGTLPAAAATLVWSNLARATLGTLLALTSCSADAPPTGSSESASTSGNTLTVANPGTQVADVAFTATVTSNYVMNVANLRATDNSSGPVFTPIPAGYTLSKSGTTLTFPLKNGTLASHPLQVEDVSKSPLLYSNLVTYDVVPPGTGTGPETVTVNEPDPLAAGNVMITGKESNPADAIWLDWRTTGVPAVGDGDWVQATVASDGTFSGVVTIDHPGTRSTMYYRVGNGSAVVAWSGVPGTGGTGTADAGGGGGGGGGGSTEVIADYGGTSSVELNVASSPAESFASLSSPATSISLPGFDVGSGHDIALYVALFSPDAALGNPGCRWGTVRQLNLVKTTTVPGTSDTVYLFSLLHGDSIVSQGENQVVCGWSSAPSLAAIGAVSFNGVQTWAGQAVPAITVSTGTGTHPLVNIPTAADHVTMAFLTHAATAGTALLGQTQSLQWSIPENAANQPNGALTVASGVNGTNQHQFTLGTSVPWAVVGIDVPNQPVNIDQRWIGPVQTNPEPPVGIQSLALEHFQVGGGANEYMVVGITSPGALSGLNVSWDGQPFSLIDAYEIPGDIISRCAHADWEPSGGSYCSSYTSSTQGSMYWYGLKLPHPGNKVLTVSWTDDLSGSAAPLVDAMALSFANVNQSTPYKSITHANGTVYDTIPVSIGIRSGGANDMTLAMIAAGGGTIYCNPSHSANVPSTAHGIGIASSRQPGVANDGVVTFSWQHGIGPANNASACSSLDITQYSVYGMSGFDLVAE